MRTKTIPVLTDADTGVKVSPVLYEPMSPPAGKHGNCTVENDVCLLLSKISLEMRFCNFLVSFLFFLFFLFFFFCFLFCS